MGGEATPAVVARPGHDPGAEGVGLDVAEDGEQVVVILDHRALEPPLPDVPAAVMAAVVALGVGDEQALHQPADRGLQRAEEEVEVVGHEAIAEQLERPPAASSRVLSGTPGNSHFRRTQGRGCCLD